MVSVASERNTGNVIIFEFRGLSTDTKPIGNYNGSVFFEIDTGKVFMYNQATNTWVEE